MKTKEILPKKVLARIQDVLEPGEVVLHFVREPWSLYKWHRWTVLTNRRVIVVKQKPLSYDMWTFFKLVNINLDMKEGIIFDSIYLSYFDHKFNLQFFTSSRKKTVDFFHAIQNQIEEVTGGESNSRAVVGELEGLARVFYEKIITKKEYEKKKKELLDKL